MNHIEKCREKFDRLRFRQYWWYNPLTSDKGKSARAVCSRQYDAVRCKDMLLVCPDGDVLKQRKEDSLLWKDLLFTDHLWVHGE